MPMYVSKQHKIPRSERLVALVHEGRHASGPEGLRRVSLEMDESETENDGKA